MIYLFFVIFSEKYIVIPKSECTKFNSIKLDAILVEKNYDEFILLIFSYVTVLFGILW